MSATLVIGASPKTNRYSNLAVRRLVENNVATVALGKTSGSIDDIQIKTNLSGLQNIDTVSLYLRPELQKEYYNPIIALSPRRVVFNPGTENEEFYDLLRQNNIEVQIACTLVLLATGQY